MFATLVTSLWILTCNCSFVDVVSKAFQYACLILDYVYAGDDLVLILG